MKLILALTPAFIYIVFALYAMEFGIWVDDYGNVNFSLEKMLKGQCGDEWK